MSKKARRAMRQHFESAGFLQWEVGELTKVFRPDCTDCSSVKLRWCESYDLVALVQPEHRLDVQGAIAQGYDGKGWLCLDCGQFGLFPRHFQD